MYYIYCVASLLYDGSSYLSYQPQSSVVRLLHQLQPTNDVVDLPSRIVHRTLLPPSKSPTSTSFCPFYVQRRHNKTSTFRGYNIPGNSTLVVTRLLSTPPILLLLLFMDGVVVVGERSCSFAAFICNHRS
jgi:hypothetical protein